MMTTSKPLGLYIHIPFCARKCNYCDFLSLSGSNVEEQTGYVKALIDEVKYYGKIYRNIYYLDSIFIGGGTPSLIDPILIGELVATIKAEFEIDNDAEISIESNPKTLSMEKLNAYIDMGINRLSIGVQSFDENLLNLMGRIHSPEDIINNLKLARESGFRNINLDLIFSIPGQTMKIWADTLRKTIELLPEHISFYSLQIEEGTPFYSLFQAGELKEIGDELDRDMYHKAVELLKNSGYMHYEISNAAKSGYQCRHNLKYWSMEEYLGLGLGAHSYIAGTRYNNGTDLKEYIQNAYNRGQHINSMEDNISEYLFTGLRKINGIDLTDFKNRFGVAFESIYGNVLDKYKEYHLIEIVDGKLRFTEKGIDISNTILTEFV